MIHVIAPFVFLPNILSQPGETMQSNGLRESDTCSERFVTFSQSPILAEMKKKIREARL
jgi:hypothetical protein